MTGDDNKDKYGNKGLATTLNTPCVVDLIFQEQHAVLA
jgi:hypothetical protein